MKVKRYVDKTIQEAINRVKLDLGQDAIIMSTRKIRQKGWLGLFRKPLVEVVAAVDEVIYTHAGRKEKAMTDVKSEKNMIGEVGQKNSLENLEQKVDAMGEMFEKLMEGMYSSTTKSSSNLPPQSIPFYNRLIENEVEEKFAERLIQMANELNKTQGMDFAFCLEQVILEVLGRPEPLQIEPGQKKRVLFLGPTGVGKTTTLAKLAATYSIQQQKKVGLITADTYRIAAVDQIKIYAEILGIPISIIYTPKELEDALQHHEDKDIVLIDTAGKSIKDREQEKEIKQMLSSGKIDDIYLVMSSNTSYRGCKNIINNYRFLPHYKLLFTKTDEITSYGVILNCCLLAEKPLSYLTTGQSVPDDIEIVEPEKIKNLLIGSVQE